MIAKDHIGRVEVLAWAIRARVLEMIGVGAAEHLGGSLSAAERIAALYCKMRHDSADPKWPGRDRFVMSKGHAALAQYAALAEYGYRNIKDPARTCGAGAWGRSSALSTCKGRGMERGPDRRRSGPA